MTKYMYILDCISVDDMAQQEAGVSVAMEQYPKISRKNVYILINIFENEYQQIS